MRGRSRRWHHRSAAKGFPVRTRLPAGASRIRTLRPTPSLAGRQTARTRLTFRPGKFIAPVEALAAASVPQSSNAETPFVCVGELGGPNFRNCLARLSHGQEPDSSARSASAASSVWRRPLRLLGKDEVCRDDRILSAKQKPKVDESGFPDEGKNFPDRPI